MAEDQEVSGAFHCALGMAHFCLQVEDGAYHIDRRNRAQEVPHSKGQNRDA